MEKMDSVPVCDPHRKVFAPLKATEVTNIRPWICALCGHEGTDETVRLTGSPNDYDLIRAKKVAGGFKHV